MCTAYHLIHGSLDRTSPHDRFSCFAGHAGVTNRETDHAFPSAAIRPHLRYACDAASLSNQVIISGPRGIFWNSSIRPSVCRSVPWRSCLGYRHAGCLQMIHRRSPEMCGLRTRPRTDVDPPRLLPPSNCHRQGAYRVDTLYAYVLLWWLASRSYWRCHGGVCWSTAVVWTDKW